MLGHFMINFSVSTQCKGKGIGLLPMVSFNLQIFIKDYSTQDPVIDRLKRIFILTNKVVKSLD